MKTSLRFSSVTITALMCLISIQKSESIDIVSDFILNRTSTTNSPPAESILPLQITNLPLQRSQDEATSLQLKERFLKLLANLTEDQFVLLATILEASVDSALTGGGNEFCIDLSKVPVLNQFYNKKFCVKLDHSGKTYTVDLIYDGQVFKTFDLDSILQTCVPLPFPVSGIGACVGLHDKHPKLCAYIRLTLIVLHKEFQLFCFNEPAKQS